MLIFTSAQNVEKSSIGLTLKITFTRNTTRAKAEPFTFADGTACENTKKKGKDRDGTGRYNIDYTIKRRSAADD